MADKKITELTATTSVVDADIFPIVVDTTGTPTTKKITALNLGAYFGGTAALDDIADVTITSATTGDLLKWNGTAWVNAAGYALLASPTFTGTPTLPTGTIATTQTALDSSTKLATTAFVTTANNLKANLASPTFTGTPTLPTGTIATTQTASNNSTAVATTAYVDTANALKANLASPTFTGTPTLPTGTIATTQTAANNTTAVATTAFVTTAVAAVSSVDFSSDQSVLAGVIFS